MNNKLVNINGEHKIGCIVRKDFHGKKIELLFVKKEEYKDKKYDLYTVYKNISNKNDKDDKYIPLYNETLTPDQLKDLVSGRNLKGGVSNG